MFVTYAYYLFVTLFLLGQVFFANIFLKNTCKIDYENESYKHLFNYGRLALSQI
jgi:hypothetical protein